MPSKVSCYRASGVAARQDVEKGYPSLRQGYRGKSHGCNLSPTGDRWRVGRGGEGACYDRDVQLVGVLREAARRKARRCGSRLRIYLAGYANEGQSRARLPGLREVDRRLRDWVY